jgi:hypothetical protein
MNETSKYILLELSIALLGIIVFCCSIIDIGTIISIGLSVFLAFISLKLTTSVRDLKNLLLIDIYTKEQASPKGRKFLLTQVFLNPKKHFILEMYIDLEYFLSLLSIPNSQKARILHEAKKKNVLIEFGADYMNRFIEKHTKKSSTK